MHVVIICNEYPPARKVGGIGVFIQTFSHSLVELGNKVTVIGLYYQEHDSEENDCGVRVIRLSSKRFMLIKLGWVLNRKRLFREIRKINLLDKIDIIETSDYEAGFYLMPLINIPKVVRINGTEVYFRTLLNEKIKFKNRIREEGSIKKANSYAAVTEFAWHCTVELFRLNQLKKYILPNFVDTHYFSPDSSIAEIKGRILFTGTFIRKKGVLELFQCLNFLFEQESNAHIVCVGNDSTDGLTKRKSTREIAMNFVNPKFHDRVTFVDQIPNKSIKQFILSAEVCIYPSFLETQGIAIIESMSCEKAVVSTNTGPGAEIIEDGRSGLLCHPTDHNLMINHILSILRSEELKVRLGTAARQTVMEKFSKSKILPLNLKWYNEVITEYHK